MDRESGNMGNKSLTAGSPKRAMIAAVEILRAVSHGD